MDFNFDDEPQIKTEPTTNDTMIYDWFDDGDMPPPPPRCQHQNDDDNDEDDDYKDDEDGDDDPDDDDDEDDENKVDHEPGMAASQVSTPPSKKKKRDRSNSKARNDTTTRRLRINDVHVAVPMFDVGTSNTTVEDQTAPTLQMNHYTVAQQRAAEQGTASNTNHIGKLAAQVNHYLIKVSDVRQQAGNQSLLQLPYTTQASGAQIGRAFYMAALTTSPHKSRPVSENAQLVRQLQSKAQFVRRQHIEAMTRTARSNEKQCFNATNCVALRFCDSQNKPVNGKMDKAGVISGGKPLVAFLFEDEYAKQQLSRQSMLQVAASRPCVQCLIESANARLTNLRFKNQAMDARAFLCVPFYVSIEAGQYPIGATIGAGQRCMEGMLFNVPRYTEQDWAPMDCTEDGEEVTRFTNLAIPSNPEPDELIQKFERLGF